MSEDEDDPFAELGTDEGDEDPFADLGDDESVAGGETEGEDGSDSDPFADIEGVESEEVGLGVRDRADTGREAGDPDDDPFAALESDDPATDFGPSENDLFTEVEVDDVDDESVWAELAGDEPQESPESEVDVELDGEPANEPGETLPEESGEAMPTVTETIVRKRTYCEKCEYFSEPPEVGCGYPEGEIVELIDTERFKVRNCPIVARRQSGEVAEVTGDAAETDGGEEL